MAYVWRQQLHKIESKQFSASSLHHLPKKNRKNIKMKAMGEKPFRERKSILGKKRLGKRETIRKGIRGGKLGKSGALKRGP